MDSPDPSSDSAPAEGARPTLKTIAFMTGLGVTTVSRALKDAPEIGEETKRRVRLVAKQIGYRPNRAGVRLRTGKTNVISLVLDTEEDLTGFVSDLIYGISETIAETPYHLIVTPYSRRNDPMDPVRYVVETGSADGIILSRTQPNDPRVAYLLEHHFPFATHGRTAIGEEHPFHDFDNRAFSAAAVRKLVELGRTRLALLPPPPDLTYHLHMREGFSDAVQELGATEVAWSGISIDDPIDAIRAKTARLMRRADRPDGLVVASGGATFALVAGIEEAGLRLGRDVDVVSKQSSRLLRWYRPELWISQEDFRLAGREVAKAVLGRIEGKPVTALQSLAAPGEVVSCRMTATA